MSNLKSLHTVSIFGLLPGLLKNLLNHLASLTIVPFSPVIPCPILRPNIWIRLKQPAQLLRALNRFKHPRFQVYQYSARDISAWWLFLGFLFIPVDFGSCPIIYLVEIYIALSYLSLIWAHIEACLSVNTVFEGDGFPKFVPDLIATLANLQSNDFSHLIFF
jgi:hypothetical protein